MSQLCFNKARPGDKYQLVLRDGTKMDDEILSYHDDVGLFVWKSLGRRGQYGNISRYPDGKDIVEAKPFDAANTENTETAEKKLIQMNKAELTEQAQKRGIVVPDGSTNRQIIDLIEVFDAANTENTETDGE